MPTSRRPLSTEAAAIIADPSVIARVQTLALYATPWHLRRDNASADHSYDFALDHAMYRAERWVKGFRDATEDDEPLPYVVRYIVPHVRCMWQRRVFRRSDRLRTQAWPDDFDPADDGDHQDRADAVDLLHLLPDAQRMLVDDFLGLSTGEVLSKDELAAKYGLAQPHRAVTRWLARLRESVETGEPIIREETVRHHVPTQRERAKIKATKWAAVREQRPLTEEEQEIVVGKPVFEIDRRGASISKCGKYRYLLWRGDTTPLGTDPEDNSLVFIGLNPSTADGDTDDPTIRRCMRFAKDLGFKGMIMVNLFAYRATDPGEMREQGEAAKGPDNMHFLQSVKGVRVAAWGATIVKHGMVYDRMEQVKNMTLMYPTKLMCLGVAKEGYPRHPLYLPLDAQLQEYT